MALYTKGELLDKNLHADIGFITNSRILSAHVRTLNFAMPSHYKQFCRLHTYKGHTKNCCKIIYINERTHACKLGIHE